MNSSIKILGNDSECMKNSTGYESTRAQLWLKLVLHSVKKYWKVSSIMITYKWKTMGTLEYTNF